MKTFNVYRNNEGVLTFEAPIFEEGEAQPLFTIKCTTDSGAEEALNALIQMEATSPYKLEDEETNEI